MREDKLERYLEVEGIGAETRDRTGSGIRLLSRQRLPQSIPSWSGLIPNFMSR